MVFQHVPFEILGTMHPLFKQDNFRIRYINFGRHANSRPNLKRYRGLIILGGPMGVNDVSRYPHLQTEIDLIRKAIDKDIPILGICLGAQLIAAALGAKVSKSSKPEIGWSTVKLTEHGRVDPLFKHFRQQEKIFQWHNDTFEIPIGAVHLASTDVCPHQAFRYKDNVYGFQFHLEADEPLIERWLETPAHQAELGQKKKFVTQ